ESGLGGSFAVWGFVQPEVARFTRVCSYDRAGLGYSDPGPSPRTAGRIARELRDLLDRSGLADPLVLVGASSGGFSMRLFATEHPGRVAGLVLVDAAHEDQHHEVPPIARFVPVLASIGAFRVLGISFDMSPDSLAPHVRVYAAATQFRAAVYKAAASEISSIQRSADEVRAGRRPLPHPVVVITGGRNADDTWRGLQRDQVKLSPRGCQIVAEDSGHVVPLDQPQVIVEAIRALVVAAREGRDAPACGAGGTK
ncbi:MAG TPA: alpha/beta hydrolase, partial [Tepidiformaceae bacterium]|nr:alpha/beta hydrolase [Tepidiformaceae bacterium]